jgi:hypothetical protein
MALPKLKPFFLLKFPFDFPHHEDIDLDFEMDDCLLD